MEPEKKRTNYPRKIARIILKGVLFLFLFIVLIFILILTPPVQKFLTGKVESYLQKKLGTRVEVGSISFGLSGKVSLNEIYIEDKTKDTLLSGGSLKAHINFLKLFSNEVEVKDLELQNITAKIKRVLPDTVYNFQFIVDAFASGQAADTSQHTAPMKLGISDVSLDNINLHYNDVITGNNIFAHIGTLSATIDTLDPYLQHFDIPSFIARNVQATVRQTKPLVHSEPLAADLADAAQPTSMRLSIGSIDLSKINIQYDNDVSAFYTSVQIGQLKTKQKLIDLLQSRIYLDQLALNNSKIRIRLGKKEAAKVVEKEVKQEIEAQKTAGWDFRIDHLQLANNSLTFDNDNNPAQNYGIDFGHMGADSLSLGMERFVMNTDTIAGLITNGSFKEKSGFRLQELKGDIVYGPTQTAIKDLYIKTPGTEIQRSAVLEYASLDELAAHFEKTVLDIELVNTSVQVKDILAFAPSLRSNPALRDPNDIWHFNIVGRGTLDRLSFEQLRFNGLRNTEINAKGTLVGLMDPKNAGGNFTIYKLHTTQSDLALFTGQRLSNAQINLPEEFDVSGTVIGNAGKLNTNLNMSTSSGSVGLNGSFSHLTDPASMTYNASLRASGLQLGKIMRQPATYGTLTGTFRFTGTGLTPGTINTRFTGNIATVGYNRYQYRNIRLNGSLKQKNFQVTADVNDPNAKLNLTASGNLTSNPSFQFSGMIDSVKTFPLHLTPDAMVFRGKVKGRVSNLAGDSPDADVLVTNALFVSGSNRLTMDTVQLLSGTSDSGNYLRLRSDLANISINGQYRLADLGVIVQNSIQPYFSVSAPATAPQVAPYNFRFTADVVYSPLLASFVPGLTSMEPVHADGTFVSGAGMNAVLTSEGITYNGSEIHNLNVTAASSPDGLRVGGNIARVKSGSLDLFNVRLNAVALNNNIDFSLGVDDQNNRNKYYLSGMLTQPTTGTYALKLRPDSLLLNYEKWNVSPDNQIVIGPNSINANNFVLEKNNQRLSITSMPGSVGSQPLQVGFTDFKLATLTAFVSPDTLFADGTINGTVTFTDIMQNPAFTSSLNITDLSMKKDTIGNVSIQVNSEGTTYRTNATITGKGNDIALTGTFSPAGKDVNMDLDLEVRRLELKTLEGPTGGMITNASGGINGTVHIGGSTAQPAIRGDLNFDHASFAPSMLGTQLKIDDEKLTVTENGFFFDNFTVRDSSDNILLIDGNVLTSNFLNYNFNLNVSATNFEVMNSTKKQNRLYYGKLNVSTDLHIAGSEVKPVVDGSITVNDGTELYVVVPQQEPGVVQRQGVVEFVDMDAPENDSLFMNMDSLTNSGLTGMDITVNVEILKEAVFNVIVDEANGDFLNVRGEAQLSTGVDPSGKITMVGSYTLEEGSYQLSFNFLQRRFDIEKGSTIVWTGEPTTAQLNVRAVYVANTAPLDLVADQISASTPAIKNTYLQKLPFEVHLNLTGELLKPIVDFDIDLPENKNYGVSNDIVTAVQSRLNQMRQDPGEVNKQVFSLLLLGRFVGQDPFQSSAGGFNAATYARESVSKLLTEQLNTLAAGLISGVDINFDLASTEDYTTGDRRNRTDLNVGLSKRLLNDRLKITVGSNFQLEGPQNTNQQSNNIAGNIALDYQLTKDGRYLVRFYRKNQYEGIVDGYIIETGLGFILSVDYNKFKEILRRRKQRVTADGTTETK
jgi:translocation and assembly module TamB